MKIKQSVTLRRWSRSKKGNLWRKTASGVIVVYASGDGYRFYIRRERERESSDLFGTEDEARQAAEALSE